MRTTDVAAHGVLGAGLLTTQLSEAPSWRPSLHGSVAEWTERASKYRGAAGGTFKSTALSACSQWQFWILVAQTPHRAQGKEINEINEYTKATRQGEHLPSVPLRQEETLRKETRGPALRTDGRGEEAEPWTAARNPGSCDRSVTDSGLLAEQNH